MNINNLIVEVTRKCNMYCDHCLRGDAMNMNIKKEYIDSVLSQVDNIGNVCFTGGEPSLNLPAMEYFLSECKRRRISLEYFYIATNAVKVTESFVMFCLKMYSYCDNKEMCRVDVSNDRYHMDEADFDMSMLQGLSFVGKKYEKDNFNFAGGTSLISEGRSSNTKGAHKPYDHIEIDSVNSFTDECDIYLNCKGEIINGCNWSYASQKKHKLCNVGELTEYYQKLIDAEVYS
jgi:hypothetical protein